MNVIPPTGTDSRNGKCLKCGAIFDISKYHECGWVSVQTRLPELGQVVWLHQGGRIWIGNREDTDGDGWLWSNSYGSAWHNGTKWEADCEQDDDYQPTHWMPLPEPPKLCS